MREIKLPADYDSLEIIEKRIVREMYITEQKGLCAYCKNKLTSNPAEFVLQKEINKRLFPDNFFKYPIHLDHDHDTGLTRGAVHNRCNAVKWQYDGD